MAHTILPEPCTGCTICALKCPTDAIIGTKKEPHFVIAELCVDCRNCGRWCPSDAVLDEFDELVPRIKAKSIPKAQVDPDMCSGCEMCMDVCPFEAISMSVVNDDHPAMMTNRIAAVDPKKCTGCQFCEDICIKHSISVDAGELDRPSSFQLANHVHSPSVAK